MHESSKILKNTDWNQYVQDARGKKPIQTAYANGISYLFITEADGWISIIQQNNTGYTGLIQSKDVGHAQSYIAMIEPVQVPVTRLC